jgi:thiol-disulfide isomerase/thioredoxin
LQNARSTPLYLLSIALLSIAATASAQSPAAADTAPRDPQRAVDLSTLDPQTDAFWFGDAADGTPTVRLYYFFSPTCPHCQAAKPFIAGLEERLPWLEVHRYAVKDNAPTRSFYFDTAKAVGIEALSVPGLVFCRQS